MSVPFKPGDRVKVEFEGVVVETPYLVPDGCVVVRGDASGTDGDEFLRQVCVSQCTLIEPEIVLPEIPGTIVQVDPMNEHDERVAFEYDSLTGGGWWRAGYRGSCTTDGVVGMCREFGYRVIPAATPEEAK